VVNDKSQGSATTHLRFGATFNNDYLFWYLLFNDI